MSYQWHIFIASLDPTKGSEQSGVRPVLVVSREQINQLLPVVNVVPITSRKDVTRTIYPNEVLLPDRDFCHSLPAAAEGHHRSFCVFAISLPYLYYTKSTKLGAICQPIYNSG